MITGLEPYLNYLKITKKALIWDKSLVSTQLFQYVLDEPIWYKVKPYITSKIIYYYLNPFHNSIAETSIPIFSNWLINFFTLVLPNDGSTFSNNWLISSSLSDFDFDVSFHIFTHSSMHSFLLIKFNPLNNLFWKINCCWTEPWIVVQILPFLSIFIGIASLLGSWKS